MSISKFLRSGVLDGGAVFRFVHKCSTHGDALTTEELAAIDTRTCLRRVTSLGRPKSVCNSDAAYMDREVTSAFVSSLFHNHKHHAGRLSALMPATTAVDNLQGVNERTLDHSCPLLMVVTCREYGGVTGKVTIPGWVAACHPLLTATGISLIFRCTQRIDGCPCIPKGSSLLRWNGTNLSIIP